MTLDKFQKAKIFIFFNGIFLFLLIIFTPFFIRKGAGFITEEAAEGIFLMIELLALIYVFHHYDSIVGQKEAEANKLGGRLRKKELELLQTFQYLGKVNVQISMVNALLEKTKICNSKNELKSSFSELLRMVCSVTGIDGAYMRIVNLENGRTMIEHCEAMSGSDVDCSPKVGNSALVEKFEDEDYADVDGYAVFFSKGNNFSIKGYVFVPNKKSEAFSSDARNFLEAVANQCEVLFLLFNSRYCVNNASKSNIKGITDKK